MTYVFWWAVLGFVVAMVCGLAYRFGPESWRAES